MKKVLYVSDKIQRKTVVVTQVALVLIGMLCVYFYW